MATVPTICACEGLSFDHNYKDDEEEQEYEDIVALYTTNCHMPREFSLLLISTYFFPIEDDKQEMNKKSFLKKLESCQYLFVRPNDIRKRFTDFVCENRARAMLPS